MKAIARDVYGSADHLELRDLDKPPIGDDEVLGRACAGVVVAVGAGVTRLRPGDEVFGTCQSGSFAEYAMARQHRLAFKPANLTFEQAAATPISAVAALQSIRDARVQPGQRVLITGAAGGVGSFAVQLAKVYGATVTGVCSTSKVELVRSLGADDVIDYTQHKIGHDDARHDIVIDTAGNRPLSLLRRAVTPRGTIALVGGGHAKGWLLGGFQRQLAAPLLSLFGSRRVCGVTARERFEDLEELTQLIESGSLRPFVDRTYALADAADAIRYLALGHPAGKVVITV